MQPYFYKIQELSTGRFYVGCQYSESSNPANFWNSYFTSCDYIKNQDRNNFIVIQIKPRLDAKDYERKYLRRMYKTLGVQKFQEVFINRNLAPGILFTEDVRNKMSAGIKESYKKRKLNGKYIPTFLGKKHSDTAKQKMSEYRLDYYAKGGEHAKGMSGKSHSEETRNKIRESVKQNSFMCGKFGDEHPTGNTKWYNNGVKHLRTNTHPGDGWLEGRIYKKRK